jgi:GntR family transcriptional regulator / MocR family aminotransferase
MKRTRSVHYHGSRFVWLELDGRGPRYAQITRALQRSIREGALSPGERLPSHRQLAADLACARNLIVLAYEQLMLEGYLIARPKSGTFVSPELPRFSVGPGRASQVTKAGELTVASRNTQWLVAIARPARSITARLGRHPIDFAYGICEPDRRVIRRLRASFSAALRKGAFGYGDPAGDPRLRQQIVDRLWGTRGIVCSTSQVIVTSGTQQALDMCAKLFLGSGDRAVVEDPGYEGARAAFAAAGATIVPVAVDDNGLDPARLPAAGARVAYVTPSHQFPTGTILSAPRRHALLSWARRAGAVIVEDDYDGDLRYQGQPLKALAGLERDANVIYCGTFAKSLFPALRLGYMVVPSPLAEAAVDAKWLADRGSSVLLQRALREVMTSGEYDRHLRRMKRRYVQRRDALTNALTRRLGDDVEIAGTAGGLHVVAWLPRLPANDLERLIGRCAARGVGVYSVASHAVRRARTAGLMLGYGLIGQQAIDRGIRIVAEEYRRLVVRRTV